MKRTALSHVHEKLGAKMVPFAGYLMPVQYSGVNDEHVTVRQGVGMFDVSHMGEFIVRGPQALDLIQKVTSNDASKLTPGKVQYSCLPNNTGGIVDDLLVYHMKHKDDEHYVLVVNASNLQKDWDWINAHNTFDAQLENISDHMSLLAVQGPKATDTLKGFFTEDIGAMPYYTAMYAEMKGVGLVLLATTGYTGSGGYEVYVPNPNVEKAWNEIMEAGRPFDIKPTGLAARDTLRLEMGFCLYGNDIDDTTSPLEAGLGWITKFTKEFTNSKALKEQKERGVEKKLVGFELIDRGIPRHDHPVVDANGSVIGRVTSGTMGPTVQKPIGMAYVPTANAGVGSEILIDVRGKILKGVVVKLPFHIVS
ncbi:MAG: glycine cleavage system aminomethyltransferase GcvT [Flavobacteriales bacterium]|nr:glycine cleavage system aminomethyltransferase GcvT [Flavobacteriales bacterium]MBK6945259.1 glycine cleavage system aminomethyltransferase GcvT [Flavobacteriales bacterium]MBK7239610.1 glycine cleavage system aminomethyltransferase GcvT [Flavobacteriales bacterium]MBK9535184.1 glycine cleavage system aminomethyltransferase GcvT [Flavobacteriales bacterium]MBP9137840.1 glycine cleavage system aminomethyltransferase GcvT [Flavobacteriales bacterium]